MRSRIGSRAVDINSSGINTTINNTVNTNNNTICNRRIRIRSRIISMTNNILIGVCIRTISIRCKYHY